jgi:hypothetical protein
MITALPIANRIGRGEVKHAAGAPLASTDPAHRANPVFPKFAFRRTIATWSVPAKQVTALHF